MKREEAERLLIAEAVKKSNIGFMIAENFDPTYFNPHKDLADGLWKKSEELGGFVPSRSSAEKAFPNFDFTPGEDVDVKEAIYIIRNAHAKDMFNKHMMSLSPLLKEKDGWKKAIESFPNGLYEIQGILEGSAGRDFARDADERYEYIRERAKDRESGEWKVNFAHPGMNEFFGGYEPGFYMYVARLGGGKTSSCLLDLWYSWTKGANVGIFSLEMDIYKVGLKIDTFETNFSNYDLNKGIIRKDSSIQTEEDLSKESEYFKNYIEKLQEDSINGNRGKFRIWTREMLKGNITPRRIEALVRDENLDFVVIDQLELVAANSGNRDERTRLNEISLDFKNMSGKLNIPILVPHQMNRETIKEKEVTPANIAGSDGPARHADFVCYLTRDKESNIMFYKILKARNSPGDKKFALEWDFDTGFYKPVDADFATIEKYSNIGEEIEEENGW